MSDQTYEDRQLSLVHALYRRTKDGKVDWQETSNSLAFEANLGEYALQIRLVPDNDYPGEPDFALEVKDAYSGRLIETISNASLRPVMDQATPEGLSPYGVLNQTYEMARRKALNVDDALDRVLAALTDK